MSDEFYIGWESKAAPDIGKAVRKAVVALYAPGTACTGCARAGATNDWHERFLNGGTVKNFSGIFRSSPYRICLSRAPVQLAAKHSFPLLLGSRRGSSVSTRRPSRISTENLSRSRAR